ncbi:MAG TPA: ABC transporter permease [Gemmatimonadales bacterium]|nr:ABC transporter permease [Gemmatimonadales bacterium]
MIDALLADLRYAVRTLRKSPGFATAAILTLALAIGSNTAVFSVVNGVLLRPLPFAEQDRLFMLAEQSRQGAFRPPSYPTFLDWRAQSSAFSGLAYVRGGGQRLAGPDGVQSIIGSLVSAGFFATLGERPLLGRLFTPDEEHSGAHVAVLSYALWQARFGGDPHIIGKALSLSDGVFTVIGVLPRDVAYPPWASEQLYFPIATVAATDRALTQRGFHADCRIIGRLKPGVTAEQAKTDLDGVARREAATYPEFSADWISVALFPLRDEILGETTPRQLLVLLAAVALVLMIGCVNVANLTLARAGARGRELAIRSALGAGRGRVVRQLLTESLVLSSVGAALGVVTAHGAVALLKRAAPAVLPRLETVQVDGWVLAFALGVTILTAVASGLLPALRAAPPDLTDSLKQGTAGAGSGRGRQRLRAALVTSEIALAVVLVVGAGLLIRSLWQLRAVNPGFDPQGLVTFYISPSPLRAQEPARLAALYTQVEDAARALPGVRSVALTNFTPLSGGGLPSPVEIPGRAPDPGRDPRVWFMTVSPGYFRTMRIPVRAGREFTEADLAPGAAIVVNEAFARAFWPGLDPIGRQVTLHKAVQGRPDFGEPFPGTVVGVVGDVHHFGLDTPAEPQVYVPFTRTVWGHMSLVVRTAGIPAGFLATLSRAVRQVDPDIPMTLAGSTGSMSAAGMVDINGGLASRRFDAWLLGSFAASALILAAIGIYGLLAYSVGERRREIGIRLALGASRGDVVSQVVGEGLRLGVAGIVLGVLIALAVTRLLAALLYGVGASDSATFLSVTVLLALVSLVASYLPARRAARVDPMVALRSE